MLVETAYGDTKLFGESRQEASDAVALLAFSYRGHK